MFNLDKQTDLFKLHLDSFLEIWTTREFTTEELGKIKDGYW